jgi:hypothetical protein
MATINRAAFAKQMVPGLNAIFGTEYKQYPEEYKDIFTTETSDQAFEEDVLTVGLGNAVVKNEGASTTYDRMWEAWTARYDHESISLGFIITHEAVADNKYGKLSRNGARALAKSFRHTKEVKGAAVLNRAFNNSYTGGDGVELLATTHPLAMGGTWANKPSTAADLNETSLEDAIIAISQWTDDRGLRIMIRPMKLIVPTNLSFTADRLLSTPGRVGTADNDINSIRNQNLLPSGWGVNHWLTDTDAWFIKTDCTDGLKFFQREALSTKAEPGFDNDVMKYKGFERYSFGWSNPRGMYGSPGA